MSDCTGGCECCGNDYFSNFGMVREFHRKYKVPVGKLGHKLTAVRQMLRVRLMTEELAEVIKAMQTGDYENFAKELADLLYVVYGAADEAGIPIDSVFAEVHRSNMTKTSAKDVGGKVQKGPEYEPPDIEAALTGRESNG